MVVNFLSKGQKEDVYKIDKFSPNVQVVKHIATIQSQLITKPWICKIGQDLFVQCLSCKLHKINYNPSICSKFYSFPFNLLLKSIDPDSIPWSLLTNLNSYQLVYTHRLFIAWRKYKGRNQFYRFLYGSLYSLHRSSGVNVHWIFYSNSNSMSLCLSSTRFDICQVPRESIFCKCLT
jgi:hypothetical protein